MAYKINFSIPETDKEVFEKLNSMKRNKSRYIVDLIKKDMGLITDSLSTESSVDKSSLEKFIENKIKEFITTDKILPINKNYDDKALIKEALSKNNDDDEFI